MGAWTFTANSSGRLYTAHPALIKVFTEALEVSPVDFGISCGYRGKDAQLAAFNAGHSTKTFPHSKHNREPAEAVDFFPFIAGRGVVWEEKRLFHLIAGVVLGVGYMLGYKLRWGGAWDGILNRPGQFDDLPHIEILEVEE